VTQSNNALRFFSAILTVGGICGFVLLELTFPKTIIQSIRLASSIVILAALFGWAVFVGIRLWQGTPYGRKWAPILFAFQIPMLKLPGLTCNWFTGTNFGPVLQFASGDADIGFIAKIGAGGSLAIGNEANPISLGVNIFAIIALVLLLRSNKSNNYASAAPDAASRGGF
jgi:hypothetical protein